MCWNCPEDSLEEEKLAQAVEMESRVENEETGKTSIKILYQV